MASKDMVPVDDDTTEVTPSIDYLVDELETKNYTLFSQDKLLKRVARERKEFKDKLEIALKELEEAKKHIVVVSDEVECDKCAIHMSNLTNLQSKYVALLDENNELKSRSGLLGVCKSCSGFNLSWQRRFLGSLYLRRPIAPSSSMVVCATQPPTLPNFEA
jgi:predicted RND superfamily exporter protein